MSVANLPEKSKKATKIFEGLRPFRTLYLTALSSLVVFFGAIISLVTVEAQTFPPLLIDGNTTCRDVATGKCPYGMTPVSEPADFLGGDAACVSFNNEFCEILTGSSDIITDTGTDRVYICAEEPRASVATCGGVVGDVGGSFGIDTDFGVHELGGSTKQIYELNYTSGIPTRIQDALNDIQASGSFDPSYGNLNPLISRSGVDYYHSITLNPDGIFNDVYDEEENARDRIQCIETSEGPRIIIPRTDRDLTNNAYSRNGSYQNILAVQAAANMGITIGRDDDADEQYFCQSRTGIAIKERGDDPDQMRCFEAPLGGTKCNLPSFGCIDGSVVSGSGIPNNVPFFDFEHSSTLRIGGTTIPNEGDTIAGRLNVVSDRFCKLNSKSYLENSSNKGCADFTETDPSDNSVQYRGTLSGDTAEIEFNADQFNRCVRCIYGGPDFSDAADGTPRDIPIYTAAGFALITSPPAITAPIEPHTEVFAVPRQGRIFTEIGCINANSTSSIVDTVLRIALAIMGLLVILRIAQGAVKLQQIGKTDPEAVKEGQEIMTSAIIALLLLIFSVALLNFLGFNILQLNQQGFTPFGIP
ncbi:MAG: hypothetical protein ACOCXP_01215 [Candidatus Dojkabacteria bacterium]